jgi:hypothetical protein
LRAREPLLGAAERVLEHDKVSEAGRA